MVSQTPDGHTLFRLFAPEASSVQLFGTFTGWGSTPISLEKSRDGWFEAELSISPGEHEFQYLIDGTRWLADYAAAGVRMTDEGAWLSILQIAPKSPAIRFAA